VAHLAVRQPLEAQNTQGVTDTGSDATKGRSWRIFPNIFRVEEKKEVAATKLVIVVGKNCPPCRRMKMITYPVLLAEGYDVTIRNADEWNAERRRLQKKPTYIVTSVPTLVYATEKGQIKRFEPGFKTPEQVKKYLKKVKK
jgi:hypothetical protein